MKKVKKFARDPYRDPHWNHPNGILRGLPLIGHQVEVSPNDSPDYNSEPITGIRILEQHENGASVLKIWMESAEGPECSIEAIAWSAIGIPLIQTADTPAHT